VIVQRLSAASRSSAATSARSWLTELLNSDEEVGLPLPVIFGFLRLATHRKVFTRPLKLDRAIEYIEAWLARPNVAELHCNDTDFARFSGLRWHNPLA